MSEKKVNFGYRLVDESSKINLVKNVFNSVASKYDIMNDLMSGGLHRLWKKRMLSELKPDEGSHLLDLAAGTGDISFAFIKEARNRHKNVSCVTSDINEEMLQIAKQRAINENIFKYIDFQVVNAEAIPFPDNSFDYVSIAFGIRNVTNIPLALSEIRRVLKPGGKFVCLEFSEVTNANLKKLYDIYSFNVIPFIGKLVAKDEASYQYLVESIRLFPKADDFKMMIESSGLSNVSYTRLTSGVVAIHKGFKQ